MKMFPLVALVAILGLAGCMATVPVAEVLPARGAVVRISIVRPNSASIELTDRSQVDAVMAFLRRREWAGLSERADTGRALYRLVLRHADGSEDYVYVSRENLVKDGYHSMLSPQAEQRLDGLCGLETAHADARATAKART
ncbi:MAG TPA: hypothetical protein VHE61_13435 [Opitutaceae bacterium]|nr:hypothetical protein [Opitutaceae bacterium]